MKKFIYKTLILLVSLTGLFLALLYGSTCYVKRNNFKNDQTESNTLVFKSHKKYDLLIAGISHARNFSRHRNHQLLENILNKSIINIGQGSGICGVNEQLFYLNYFYSKGNRTDTILYVISPPMLYSNNLPKAKNTFSLEPFSIHFLYNYLSFKSEHKTERIHHYLKSKMGRYWLKHIPFSKKGKIKTLHNNKTKDTMQIVDSSAMKKGLTLAYGDSLNTHRFNKSCKRIEEEILLAKQHQSVIVFLITPTTFGQWPGHQSVVDFMAKMKEKHGVSFYDYSETMKGPQYYYDHHHLNTVGVAFFTKKYLVNLFHQNIDSNLK